MSEWEWRTATLRSDPREIYDLRQDDEAALHDENMVHRGVRGRGEGGATFKTTDFCRRQDGCEEWEGTFSLNMIPRKNPIEL